MFWRGGRQLGDCAGARRAGAGRGGAGDGAGHMLLPSEVCEQKAEDGARDTQQGKSVISPRKGDVMRLFDVGS